MCYSLPLPPFILTENREQQRFIFYLEEKIAVDKPSRVSNTNQFQNLWQLDKTRQTKQIFMKWMSTTIPVCQEKKKLQSLLTSGTELIAPMITADSQRATIAPPPYAITVVLFSSASHCQSTKSK